LSLPYQLTFAALRILDEANVFEQSKRLETGPHISTAKFRNLSQILDIQKCNILHMFSLPYKDTQVYGVNRRLYSLQ